MSKENPSHKKLHAKTTSKVTPEQIACKKKKLHQHHRPGVVDVPTKLTSVLKSLNLKHATHEAVRPTNEATPMAITTGKTTPPLANNEVMATRWPMD